MIIKYSPSFFKKLRKVDVRIRKSVKKQMLLFSKNPMILLFTTMRYEMNGKDIEVSTLQTMCAQFTRKKLKEIKLLHSLLQLAHIKSYTNKRWLWVFGLASGKKLLKEDIK